MQFFKEIFNSTPWLNFVFFVLAIVGLILSFYFYHKAKRDKSPVFVKRTFKLIQQNVIKLENLEIKYEGRIVENLSLTKLAFWNYGREALRKDDIALNDPLLISSSGKTIIYDVEISYQNKVNSFSVDKMDDHCVNLNFDFLNHNDGVVLDIYHSGNDGSDILLTGTLIGAKKIADENKSKTLSDRLGIFFKPADYLTNRKNSVLKVFGLLCGLLAIFLMMPLLMIVGPLDFLYGIMKRKLPKQFKLYA